MGFSDNWSDIQCELQPVEYKVVVLPDKIDETVGEGSTIVRPEQNIEREQRAQVRGTLIAIGDMAFSDWEGTKPQPGQKVFFAQYAGIYTDLEAPNGTFYRVMQDKDIAAIIKEK